MDTLAVNILAAAVECSPAAGRSMAAAVADSVRSALRFGGREVDKRAIERLDCFAAAVAVAVALALVGGYGYAVRKKGEGRSWRRPFFANSE